MKLLIRKKLEFKPTLSAPELESLCKDLETIGQFLSKAIFPIYLVGGIGMALSSGGLYRNNKDIDLMIFREHLSDFCEYISTKGYATFRQVKKHNATKQYQLFILQKTNPEGILAAEGKKIRLTKEKGFFQQMHTRMDYIDFFICQESNSEISLLERSLSFPKEDFFPTKEIKLKNKTSLSVPNPKYFEHIKRFLGRPIDIYDLEKNKSCSSTKIKN